MSSLHAKEQVKAIKSFRRKLNHRGIPVKNNKACHLWVKMHLNDIWRAKMEHIDNERHS